jgi:hypothetical protein
LRTKTWPEVAKWFNLLICRHWFKFEATSIAARAGGSKDMALRCRDLVREQHRSLCRPAQQGPAADPAVRRGLQIADKVWEVAEGAMTDEDTEILWLVFGNPTETTGRFRECFAGGRFAHRWHPRQIDSREVPGTNKAEIAQMDQGLRRRQRLRARPRQRPIPPRRLHAVHRQRDGRGSAMQREAVCHLRQGLVMGVDVARFGDDQQVIVQPPGPGRAHRANRSSSAASTW